MIPLNDIIERNIRLEEENKRLFKRVGELGKQRELAIKIICNLSDYKFPSCVISKDLLDKIRDTKLDEIPGNCWRNYLKDASK